MEWFCALVLCVLVSSSSAVSPPKIPDSKPVPLNCNETESLVGLALDLVNKDRDEGFVFRPVRIQSVFEQRVEKVAGSSIYYIHVDVIETPCSVLSRKMWRDCNQHIHFHELVYGECKIVYYVSRPWRKLDVLNFNCSMTPVPSKAVVTVCPDCPVIVSDITPDIEERAKRLVTEFNKDSNQTHHFKLNDIERVRTQWMFGQSFFFYLTMTETECLKTQADVILENCNSLKDNEAHVAFCTGGTYHTPQKEEKFHVTCEVYDPLDDDDHHPNRARHGHCHHGEEGAKVDQDNTDSGEAGATDVPPGEKEETKDTHGKCKVDKGKSCEHKRGHKHHCHSGRHHHHHHHPRHCHHHHSGCHHHHDHHNHSHPHDHHHHHHHHNHTSQEEGSSSKEGINQKPSEDKPKGSVQMYYNIYKQMLPTPVISLSMSKRRFPWTHVPEPAEFPHEPSPLHTCPSGPVSDLPPAVKDYMFA